MAAIRPPHIGRVGSKQSKKTERLASCTLCAFQNGLGHVYTGPSVRRLNEVSLGYVFNVSWVANCNLKYGQESDVRRRVSMLMSFKNRSSVCSTSEGSEACHQHVEWEPKQLKDGIAPFAIAVQSHSIYYSHFPPQRLYRNHLLETMVYTHVRRYSQSFVFVPYIMKAHCVPLLYLSSFYIGTIFLQLP